MVVERGRSDEANGGSSDLPVSLEDYFGFLRYDLPIVFEGISINPLANHADIVAAINRVEHEDGFWYSPPSRRVELDPHTHEPVRDVPNTERPAFLWKVPATHRLTVPTNLDRDAFRRETGLFVIHLLGYLFGTRLQFEHWWVDNRIPTKLQARFVNAARVVEPFMSTCYQTWQTWTPEERKSIAGLLYMHTRVPSYEWIWERFTFEYMVFDGLYALAAPRHGLPSRGNHSERIDRLCEALRIPTDASFVERIVQLRNNLFHQLTFGDQAPGFGGHNDVYVLPYRLRDLNRRIIAGLLGWDVPFVHSGWWHLDIVPFDL